MKTKTSFFTKFVTTLLLLIIVFISLPFNGSASSNQMEISVYPTYPSNQVDKTLGYFDLLLSSESQYVYITIKNLSDKEKIIDIALVPASTTSAGVINYTALGVSNDTQNIMLTDIASIEEYQKKIVPNGSIDIEIKLDVPKNKFDGVILGSVKVTDVTERLKREKLEVESTSGFNIYNEFEYVIAIMLRQNNNIVPANFIIGEMSSKIVNARPAIIIPIKNTENILVKGAKFSGKLTLGKEEIFTINRENVDLAPNSIMNYEIISAEENLLVTGTYRFTGIIEYEGQTWNFSDKYKFDYDALFLNDEDSTQTKGISGKTIQLSPKRVSTIVVIGASSAVILAIAILIIRIIKQRENS